MLFHCSDQRLYSQRSKPSYGMIYRNRDDAIYGFTTVRSFRNLIGGVLHIESRHNLRIKQMATLCNKEWRWRICVYSTLWNYERNLCTAIEITSLLNYYFSIRWPHNVCAPYIHWWMVFHRDWGISCYSIWYIVYHGIIPQNINDKVSTYTFPAGSLSYYSIYLVE